MKGIDCATPLTKTTSKSLAAGGMGFVCRYLVPEGYEWKRLTRPEAEAITEAGMQIISVFETSAGRPAGGANAGQADGVAAYKEAQLIGQPAGTTIYFAVDYDAQPADFDNIEAYLRAAGEQIPGYEAGVYGSYDVIEEMARRGAAKRFWQTYAWSRGQKSQEANIYQYRNDISMAGIGVDLNESFGCEGFWNTEVKPKMSPEDANKIIAFLAAAWKASDDPEAQAEFHRLANELRKVSGQPEE